MALPLVNLLAISLFYLGVIKVSLRSWRYCVVVYALKNVAGGIVS